MLSVLSHAAAADHVVLVLGTTASAAVRCLAKTEQGAPSVLAFEGLPAVDVETTGEYRIDGLAEGTAYFAYCLAVDALGQQMMNAVADTETAFETLLGGRARRE